MDVPWLAGSAVQCTEAGATFNLKFVSSSQGGGFIFTLAPTEGVSLASHDGYASSGGASEVEVIVDSNASWWRVLINKIDIDGKKEAYTLRGPPFSILEKLSREDFDSIIEDSYLEENPNSYLKKIYTYSRIFLKESTRHSFQKACCSAEHLRMPWQVYGGSLAHSLTNLFYGHPDANSEEILRSWQDAKNGVPMSVLTAIVNDFVNSLPIRNSSSNQSHSQFIAGNVLEEAIEKGVRAKLLDLACFVSINQLHKNHEQYVEIAAEQFRRYPPKWISTRYIEHHKMDRLREWLIHLVLSQAHSKVGDARLLSILATWLSETEPFALRKDKLAATALFFRGVDAERESYNEEAHGYFVSCIAHPGSYGRKIRTRSLFQAMQAEAEIVEADLGGSAAAEVLEESIASYKIQAESWPSPNSIWLNSLERYAIIMRVRGLDAMATPDELLKATASLRKIESSFYGKPTKLAINREKTGHFFRSLRNGDIDIALNLRNSISENHEYKASRDDWDLLSWSAIALRALVDNQRELFIGSSERILKIHYEEDREQGPNNRLIMVTRWICLQVEPGDNPTINPQACTRKLKEISAPQILIDMFAAFGHTAVAETIMKKHNHPVLTGETWKAARLLASVLASLDAPVASGAPELAEQDKLWLMLPSEFASRVEEIRSLEYANPSLNDQLVFEKARLLDGMLGTVAQHHSTLEPEAVEAAHGSFGQRVEWARAWSNHQADDRAWREKNIMRLVQFRNDEGHGYFGRYSEGDLKKLDELVEMLIRSTMRRMPVQLISRGSNPLGTTTFQVDWKIRPQTIHVNGDSWPVNSRALIDRELLIQCARKGVRHIDSSNISQPLKR